MARVGASLRHVSTLRLADLRQLRHGQPEDLPPAPLPVPAGSLAAEAEKERSTDLVRRKQRNPGTSTVAMGKTKKCKWATGMPRPARKTESLFLSPRYNQTWHPFWG